MESIKIIDDAINFLEKHEICNDILNTPSSQTFV